MKRRCILCLIVPLCFSIFIILSSVPVQAEDIYLFSRPFFGIYLMKGDSEERIIYRHGAHIAPRLSPTGESILFHSLQGGKMGIWSANLKGEERKRLCDGDQANWSLEGKRIIFRREGRIMEKEMASGKERIVTPEGWFTCEFPSYLPDGRVMFVSSDQIFLITPDGKTAPELLINEADRMSARPGEADIRSAPRCSPDRKKIAYQNGAHIYLVDLADRKSRQLTTAGGVQSWPVWSQDSQSICYCQSPEAFGGPWDIYNVRIDQPRYAGLIARDVEVSPDWRGSAPRVSDSVKIKGILGAAVFKHLTKEPGLSDLNIALSDWWTLHLSVKESKFLFSAERQQQDAIELMAVDMQGRPATEIESASILDCDSTRMVLRVDFRSESGDVMEVTFILHLNSPFVEIAPSEGMGGVYIKCHMELALLPDRFADDLIFAPDQHLASKIPLPYAPFMIGLPEDGMMLIVTPSEKQKIRLIKDEQGDSFEGVEVSTAGERIFVSFLPGEGLWHRTKVSADFGKDKWKTRWSNPFLAQWRIVVAGAGGRCSRMWDEEDLDKLSGESLPIEGRFSAYPDLSVVYVYGRSWNTPLDVLTPMDILRDTLGIDKLNSVLDVEGIRTYRTADEPVPLHTLLTSQGDRLWPEGSSGWPQTLDFSPFHPLLVRIRMVERKGVESTAAHLCEDILNLLKGLDNRIKEYEEFLGKLEEVCAANNVQGPEVDRFLAEVKRDIESLRGKLNNSSITRIGTISSAIEEVKGCLGTCEELWDRDEFYEFWDLSGSALLARQGVLAKYRDFVKQVRINAGILVTKDTEASAISEEIRKLTQSILRNRYYLEGDWRGEKPL